MSILKSFWITCLQDSVLVNKYMSISGGIEKSRVTLQSMNNAQLAPSPDGLTDGPAVPGTSCGRPLRPRCPQI